MSGSSWKVAYADFVTALMAFFLLMWILAAADDKQKAMLAGYFADPSSTEKSSPAINTPHRQGTGGTVLEQDPTGTSIWQYLHDWLQREGMTSIGQLSSTDSGILLRVGSGTVFEPNQADMSIEGARVVMAVAEVMRLFKANLIISGHTDSGETGAPLYANKWELSAARAAIVTQYLVEHAGIPASMITSITYADTRPAVPPDASQQPNQNNRRIEFLFLRSGLKLNNIVE